jgi:hypothetical protein
MVAVAGIAVVAAAVVVAGFGGWLVMRERRSVGGLVFGPIAQPLDFGFDGCDLVSEHFRSF